MCIAIYKPKGKVLTPDTLTTCFANNPDGAGFMFARDGCLVTRKGYFTFDEFWLDFAMLDQKLYDMVLHFRIATHGKINYHNCHPHKVKHGLGMVHNGIIACQTDKHNSDSIWFTRNVLARMPKGWYRDPVTLDAIGARIGRYNKLIIASSSGDIAIVNEEYGIWDNGIWYSNDTYIPAKHYGKIADDMDDDLLPLDYDDLGYCFTCDLEIIHDWEREDGRCIYCGSPIGIGDIDGNK